MLTLYLRYCLGCGDVTYTEKNWKIRPFCSSCGRRDRMGPAVEYHAKLEEVSILGFPTQIEKELINHDNDNGNQ